MTILLLIFSLFATAAEPEGATGYSLGAGDVITITVFGEEDLSRQSNITRTCRVEVPLIGSLEVCGRTTKSVAAEIQGRLADGYLNEPRVFVDVAEYGSQKIEVKGAVKKPGVYVLTGQTTLSEAVSMAGGPDTPNVIAVKRISESEEQEYDLQKLGVKDPVWVSPGDVVVLLRPATVQVFGQVQNRGPVAYHEGLTVTEALGLAGGATDIAGLGRAYIRRANGDRQRVNIRRIQLGVDDDVTLNPNDQLIIRKALL